MSYLIMFLINIAMMILMKQDIEAGTPPSIDQLEFPTVDETRNITVFFGTNKIKSASNIWAGTNFRTERMTKKVGVFPLDDNVTTGYRFFISLASCVGFGKVYLRRIYFKDEEVYQSDYLDSEFGDSTKEIYIDKPDIFKNDGDEVKDNGVKGYVNFYDGTQIIRDPHIEEIQGVDTLPPFKKLSYFVFKDFYFGNNKVLATPEFEVLRLPNAISEGEDYFIKNEDGSYDANPVEIIYDLMQDSDLFGVGVDENEIDIDNFKAIAKKLKNEGFGLSMTLESGTTFDDIRLDIQKHISCNIFKSNFTGKWMITLNRDDYNSEDLFELNDENGKISKYSKTQISSLYTEVKITFNDRQENYTDRMISAKTQSTLNVRGKSKTIKDDFKACKNIDLANKIAAREILGYSKPLSTLELNINRKIFEANELDIGDVVRVKFDKYNINSVYRVKEVDFGLFSDNTIKINLLEDIFSFGSTLSTSISGSKFEKPQEKAYDFKAFYSEANIFFGEANNIIIATGNFSNRSRGFELYTKSNQIRNYEKYSDTTPTGILKQDISELDEDIVLYYNKDNYSFDHYLLNSKTESSRRLGQNLAIISDGVNQEYISFEDLERDSFNNTATLKNCWRGCLDTLPKNFKIDEAFVFFISESIILENIDSTYTLNKSVTFDIDKIYSTKTNVTAVEDETIIFQKRTDKPFLPQNLLINGFNFKEEISLTDKLELQWSHADRKECILKVKHFKDLNIEKEKDVLYNIYIYDDNNILLKSITNLDDDNYIFEDEEKDENNNYHSELNVVIESVRNNIKSHEQYNLKIKRV